ncbi:lipase family protein [Luteimonas sp. SJ-92]|uniref:Lipase family protein n=1 Tax=Luteimonas salinisoli TaxID=2752307 RepID=A0A853JE45_9GAMM|nr:lipase family protein [Luteimonas salinisoli]NZA27125.1 lipase family protein [Luteimonas salinisoli]
MNETAAAAAAQPVLAPQLTLALAQASMAAYAAFDGTRIVPPPDFRLVASWTGWDAGLFGGVEEPYGLLFQSTYDPGTCIFAFRGTDSDMDAVAEADFITTDFVPASGALKPAPQVSSGFYGIYHNRGGGMAASMRGQLFALLDRFAPARIFLTGHSLGAALSQLFSLDLAVSRSLQATNINFASPMVGTLSWQQAWDARVGAANGVRCYNYWDYVPTMPPSLAGYVPVGQGFRTAFYVRDAWFVDELPRHSLANLQTVLQHALWLHPQVWSGVFQDHVAPPRLMQSDVPPPGAQVAWAERAREALAFERSLRSAAAPGFPDPAGAGLD